MVAQNTKLNVHIFQICVDKIMSKDISGRLYCGIMPQGTLFFGIAEVILAIDGIMDKIDFPESILVKKSFVKKDDVENGFLPIRNKKVFDEMKTFDTSLHIGNLATLILVVNHRENSSWQGTVEWVEKMESYKFDSELELISFIDKTSRGFKGGAKE